jgi:Mlc titration factor MtfA (ptsG expression regulator)
MWSWLTERRRAHLLAQPFPDAWRGILETNVAAYALLDAEERSRLCQLVQVFVAEKHWEGCGGLALTDDIRVTIAGCACLMILYRDHDLFARVDSILVYPSAVMARRSKLQVYTSPIPVRDEHPVLGSSLYGGPVVLAWDDAVKGARDPHDGRNLVFHELAHKIDELGGVVDGTPPLPDAAHRRAWARAFEPAFLAQRARRDHGQPSFLRDYAVTNEAEYFACATESFFEQPAELARELPDVYAQLREFFHVDLAARSL